MKEKFINSGINFVTKYSECDELKIKKMKYGFEGIYYVLIKLIVVLSISLFTKTFKETGLLLIFYASLRTYAFGLHAKTNIGCWITSIIIYNIMPLIIRHITIPYYIGYIVFIVGLLSFILWAPADTPNRPLIRKNIRFKSKCLSILMLTINYIIYLLNINSTINSIITCAVILESILINPISYKISKTQFNNYKYYHKKES